MKKTISIISTLIAVLSVNAQNCYDPYADYIGPNPYLTPLNNPHSYEGEYQFFINENTASTPLTQTRIELVSFPFKPNCINNWCRSDSTKRQFHVIDDSKYDGIEMWNTNIYERRVWDNSDQQEFHNLNSNRFTKFGEPTKNGLLFGFEGRRFFCHSILKHSVLHQYYNQGADIKDTIDVVLDHTRGRMRYYPFKENNSSSSATEHDIIIGATISCNESTYFKELNLELRGAEGAEYAGYNESSAGEQLLYLGGAPESPVKHEYIVDKAIDLRKINPTERIFYNPEEVYIDINNLNTPLVFPKNYTFKTVNGVYPTDEEMQAANPNNLDYRSPLLYPVDNDYHSTYIIRSGSKVILEPCVNIMDATFIIEEGGHLVYDPNFVDGNFIVDDQSTSGTGLLTVEYDEDIPCAMQCFKDDFSYDHYSMNINYNTTWNENSPIAGNNNTFSIQREIVVQSGNTLEINDLTLEFGPKGKIVVLSGAKLIANNTTFEPACQFMWEGIEIQGIPTMPQNPLANGYYHQGYAEFNHCKIEQSRKGVYAGGNNNGGGIIRAFNSEFKNNAKGIGIYNYEGINNNYNYLSNKSIIQQCDFIIDNVLNEYSPNMVVGVDLESVKKVRIKACQFRNEISDEMKEGQKGMGVSALEAQISVGGCLSIVQVGQDCNTGANTFEGLSKGIWVRTAANGKLIWINGNSFLDNEHGVVVDGARNLRLSNNYFRIPHTKKPEWGIGHPDYVSIYDQQDENINQYNAQSRTGLYLVETRNPIVTNNTFEGTAPVPQNRINYGILVNNTNLGQQIENVDGFIGSCSPSNSRGDIYKNTFKNLGIALQAEGDNVGDQNDTYDAGLRFNCNTFSNALDYAFTLTGKSAYNIEKGNIRDQNSPQEEANNDFQNSGYHLYNGTNSLSDWTYYVKGFNPSSPYPNIHYPSNNQNANIVYNGSYYSNPTTDQLCPSYYNTTSTIEHQLHTVNQEHNHIHTEYRKLKDGGSTDVLMARISRANSKIEINRILHPHTPYLSDEVLQAAFERFPNQCLLDYINLLFANGRLSEKMQEFLQPYLCSRLSQLFLRWLSRSHLTSWNQDMQDNLNYKSFEKEVLKKALYQNHLQEEKISEAYTVLDDSDNPCREENMLSFLTYTNQYPLATTWLHRIKRQEALNEEMQLMEWYLQLRQKGKYLKDLDADMQERLTTMTYGSPLGIRAKVWRQGLEGKSYPRIPYPLVKSKRTMPFDSQDELSLEKLSVFPNPSSERAVVLWQQATAGVSQLIVSDINGRIVWEEQQRSHIGTNAKVLETASWSAGMYVVQITSNGMRQSTKLLKVH